MKWQASHVDWGNVMSADRKTAAREGTTGRHLGRPPKPAELVRSERVVTFVTPNEYAALVRLSEQWETSVSGTIHRLMTMTLEAEFQASAASKGTQV